MIHQTSLRLPISPMLKEVMARCWFIFIQVSVNFVQTVLVVDTLMWRQNLSFSAYDLLHIYNVVHPKKVKLVIHVADPPS